MAIQDAPKAGGTLDVRGETRALIEEIREPGESDDALVWRLAWFYRNARSPPASPFGPMPEEGPNVPSGPPAPGPPPGRHFGRTSRQR